ncbi:MAG TPA: hypothetical protein VF250_10765 [Conexibacter sp.]
MQYTRKPHHKLAWATALAVLAICAAFTHAGTARATDLYWNCDLVVPNSWCYAPYTHTYGYTGAWANNYPTMNLCSKLTRPDDHQYYYARKCGYGTYVFVWSNGGGRAPYPNNSVSMHAGSANGDNPYDYPMNGFARY